MLDLLPFFATHKYNTNGIAAIEGFFLPFFALYSSGEEEEQRSVSSQKCAIITQTSLL